MSSHAAKLSMTTSSSSNFSANGSGVNPSTAAVIDSVDLPEGMANWSGGVIVTSASASESTSVASMSVDGSSVKSTIETFESSACKPPNSMISARVVGQMVVDKLSHGA